MVINTSTIFNARLTSATILFGESATQSHRAYLDAGRSEAVRFRAVSSGATGLAQILIDSSNTARSVLVGVYSDANGHPGSLLSSGVIAAPIAGAWNSVAITPMAITPNAYYWLAILGEGGTLHYRNHQRGTCLSSISAQHTLAGFPGTWSSGSLRHECPLSGYVTATDPILVPPPPPTPPPAAPPLPASPVDTELPVLDGTTTEGQVLSTTTGTWTGTPTSFAYQWQDCNGEGAGCANIAGATSATYTLSGSDVGSTVRVLVTAANAGGVGTASSAVSARVAAIPPPAPVNTLLPTLGGAATEGQTLTATTGAWTENPTSFSYQWQDCDALGNNCVNTSGASAQTYTLSASDVGDTVRVVVTATNGGGSTAVTSAPSATIAAVPPPPPSAPVNTVLPAISGATTEGQMLSATAGTWTESPTSFTYQWQDCDVLGSNCVDISGASTQTYTLGASDVGDTVRVVVTATNQGGSVPADSAASIAVVAPPPAAPTNTEMPAIGGNAIEGEVLKTSNGGWTGKPTSYSYQWRDCDSTGHNCSSIGGATAASYRLSSSDVSHTMRVMVTASNTGGSSSMSAPATALVAAVPPPAPSNTVLPAVSGASTEGQTLTATGGTWSGSPSSFEYQWQDCNSSGSSCSNKSGATSSSYTLGSSDVEHTMRVVVTATNSGGSTAATSAASSVVVALAPPAPGNTVLPAISGTTTEGQTLSATTGTWTGSPTGFTYQWQDCNSSGSSCSNKSGATSSSYTLGSSDVEHTMRVVVTATNSGGSTAATSAASASVAAVVVSSGCTTTIGSGLSTAIKNAAAGSTICLNAGNYGEVSVTVSKSSMVTVKPAAGVSQSQAVLGYANVTTSSNITFEGLTIAGGNTGGSSAPATHIHWVSDTFTSGLCILTPTSANIDILVEGSTFFNIGEGKGGCGNEGRLEVNGENKGVSGTNGVVISHSTFGRNGCTDGVNITGGGSGTVIGPGDVFENMKEGSCAAHVDPIQFYGAQGTTVTGDYFHGNSDGIMSPDGNGSPMTVTNDVFDTDGEYPWQIVIGGGSHDVISHDTFGHGAMVRIGHVNVGASSSETISNNVITGGLDLSEGQSTSGFTMVDNLTEGQAIGTGGIVGKPTYAGGGSEPSTWAGWALTSGSLGHLGASDGTNVGSGYFGS
ncbi:MAG TPA: hypothetical protein VGI26_04100 [Solirubrobacteraceae bacterium]